MQNEKFEGYDIILQAGQSNSEGCGRGEAYEPYEPNENILYMANDLSISIAKERIADNIQYSDFSLFFAREYIKKGLLKNGRKILILRAAVGGTGFLDNRWGKNDDLFLKMLEMIKHAKRLEGNNRFIAFLWHQGETDAVLKAKYDDHYNNLAYLLDATRQEIGNVDLPFVAGDFVYDWKKDNMKICEPVINAIKQVCEDKNGSFILTEDLSSNKQEVSVDDTIHFSSKALQTLGTRYFNAIFG